MPDPRSEEEKQKDHIYGADNKVAKVILCPDANWSGKMGKDEKQYSKWGVDGYICVSSALTNKGEAVFTTVIDLAMFPETDVAWLHEKGYFDETGQINFSEMHLAYSSETTKKGNYYWKVMETARKTHGLVPDSMWPFPDNATTWEELMTPPANLAEIDAVGQEFLKRFKINYESIPSYDHDAMEEALKESPLEVFGYAWPLPVDGIYPKSTEQINHAFCSVFEDKNSEIKKRRVFDSYNDNYTGQGYYKNLAWDYIFDVYAHNFIVNSLNYKEDVNKTLMAKLNANPGKIYFVPGSHGEIGLITSDGKLREAKTEHELLEVLLAQFSKVELTKEEYDAANKISFH